MPRAPRANAGGYIYHVSNIAAGRKRLFRDAADYAGFLEALAAAKDAVRMRILGYCLMPDHWHLVVWPRKDGDLSRFVLRVATAHIHRYRDRHHIEAGERLYAERFRSFPIQNDEHLLDILRYIESNAVRAKLAKRPGQWAWSSLKMRGETNGLVEASPVKLPRDWPANVAEPLAEKLVAMQTCRRRSRPYGTEVWTRRTADRLGLGFSLRPQGRPRKNVDKETGRQGDKGRKKPGKAALRRGKA